MALTKKLGLVALLVLAPVVAAAAGPVFRVVANPSVTVESLSRDQLSRYFLKKETRWPDGKPVLVAGRGDPAIKGAFAEQVQGRSLGALRSYWSQMVFSGRDVPPVERQTDDDVLAYVRSNPGAIAYVSAGAATDGVKTIAIR